MVYSPGPTALTASWGMEWEDPNHQPFQEDLGQDFKEERALTLQLATLGVHPRLAVNSPKTLWSWEAHYFSGLSSLNWEVRTVPLLLILLGKI